MKAINAFRQYDDVTKTSSTKLVNIWRRLTRTVIDKKKVRDVSSAIDQIKKNSTIDSLTNKKNSFVHQVALIEKVLEENTKKFGFNPLINDNIQETRLKLAKLIDKYDIYHDFSPNNLDEFYSKIYRIYYQDNAPFKEVMLSDNKELATKVLSYRFHEHTLKRPFSEIMHSLGIKETKNSLWSKIKSIYRHKYTVYIDNSISLITSALISASGYINLPLLRGKPFIPDSEDILLIMNEGFESAFISIKDKYKISSNIEAYKETINRFYNPIALGSLVYSIYMMSEDQKESIEYERNASAFGEIGAKAIKDEKEGLISKRERDQMITNGLLENTGKSVEGLKIFVVNESFHLLDLYMDKYQQKYTDEVIEGLESEKRQQRLQKRELLIEKINTLIDKAENKVDQVPKESITDEQRDEILEQLNMMRESINKG